MLRVTVTHYETFEFLNSNNALILVRFVSDNTEDNFAVH